MDRLNYYAIRELPYQLDESMAYEDENMRKVWNFKIRKIYFTIKDLDIDVDNPIDVKYWPIEKKRRYKWIWELEKYFRSIRLVMIKNE